MQPEPRMSGIDKFKRNLNVVAFFCQAGAVSAEMFLHSGFGPRYVGTQGFVAALMIFFFGIFFPREDLQPLMGFLLAYLFMCLVTRIGGLLNRRKSMEIHTRYTGRPRLLRLFPRANELTIKRLFEPLLVCALGAALYDFERPLGAYLAFVAGPSLFVTTNLALMYERTRAMDMNDALIEAEMAERFRQNGEKH